MYMGGVCVSNAAAVCDGGRTLSAEGRERTGWTWWLCCSHLTMRSILSREPRAPWRVQRWLMAHCLAAL